MNSGAVQLISFGSIAGFLLSALAMVIAGFCWAAGQWMWSKVFG